MTAFKASPLPILLDAGEAFTWTVSLSTALGAHTAEFEGQWVAAPGSWDANKQNSIATGSVMVESKLKLNWEYATFDLRDAENNTAELPLTDGEAYTLTIGLTSQETGSANYTCQDSSNTVLSSMEVDIVNRGDRASLSCTFAATASMTTVRLIPEDASISSTLSRSFATLATNADGDGAGSSSETGTVALFGAIAVALIGALVAAVVLTREREEEVERDIFEYCPACDGELEGTEDRCPHCSFNLKKARNQFTLVMRAEKRFPTSWRIAPIAVHNKTFRPSLNAGSVENPVKRSRKRWLFQKKTRTKSSRELPKLC